MKRLTDTRTQRRNANRHTPRGLGALEGSIQRDGWIGAITVAADGETFDGSARIEVGVAAGFDDAVVVESDGSRPVIVRRTDIPTADDPRAKRLGLAANRIAQLDLDWDAEVLTELAQELDLSALFSTDELSTLMPAEVAPGGGGDAFDPTPDDGPTRAQLGDLWQIGGVHRLLVGDCTDAANVARLMGGERAGALIYDPPWDADMPLPDTALTMIVFCDGRHIGDMVSLFGPPCWLFTWDCVSSWYTPNRPLQRAKYALWYGDVTLYQFDGAHYGDAGVVRQVFNTRGSYTFVPDPRGKHLSDVFSFPITQLHKDNEHAHEKPLDWVTMLIANCTSGLVYDPFLGSGTTLIAAHRTGRRCYGCELEPRYADVILKRAEAEGLCCELVSKPTT